MEIPLLRMLSMPIENLQLRAEKIVAQIAHLGYVASAQAVPEQSMLGGGSVPTQQIPTWSVAVQVQDQTVDRIAKLLRDSTPAVVGRVHKERLLIDIRTVEPSQDAALVEVFGNLEI